MARTVLDALLDGTWTPPADDPRPDERAPVFDSSGSALHMSESDRESWPSNQMGWSFHTDAAW